MVTRTRAAAAAALGAVLALAVLPSGGTGQQGSVGGVVVAQSSGQPLAGAQVVVVGTERGTITDPRGRFLITGVSGAQVTLRVVLIGYQQAEETVAVGNTGVRIALQDQVIGLDQIVVTGTAGGQTKRSLGNALSQVDAAELTEMTGVDNVSDLLTARAPGVVLQAQQGVAGGGSRIQIRGRSSMQFVGNPLIYVDGVRVNNSFQTGPQIGDAGAPSVISRLDDIDPGDIESIEIIKGPAAATLYGTEASSGVVQIITKKGRAGGTRFNVQMRQGAAWYRDEVETAGRTFWRNPGTGEVLTFNAVEAERAAGYDFFRRGHLQGYGADISGGAESIQYYVSANYDRDEGVVPDNTSRKFRGRANLTFQPTQTVNVNTSLGISTGRVDTFNGSYFLNARYGLPQLMAGPTLGFLDQPGHVTMATEEIFQDFDHFTGAVNIDHRPAEWFSQRLAVGLDLTHEENTILVPFVPEEFAQFFSPTNRLGFKNIVGADVDYTTVDYGATVTLPVNADLGTATSVGLQYYRRLSESQVLSGQQFPAPGVTALEGISGPRNVSEDLIEETTVGVYLQEQLSWRDRLFLTGAIRADDNSAFGADFDLVTYPKVSLAWVVSEESFWDVGFVDALKLRAAYGESGQQPAAFAAIRTYEPITGGDGRPAGTPRFVGNPDLGPERGKEIEVGFDAAFFQDRVGIDFTYYNQRTEDAIVSRNVAASTGFPSTQFVNGGEVKNTGFEVLLRGRPIQTDNVAWDLSFNFSKNDNEVLSINLPDVPFIPVSWIPNRHTPGYPVNSYWGKRILSAEYDANNRPVNVLCDDGSGAAVPCSQAADVFLGQASPDTEGSFSTTLTLFDRLRVHGLFDFQLGRSYFSAEAGIKCAIFGVHEINVYPERFDPVDAAACAGAGTFFNNRFIASNDFGKLREISLNYSVPEDLMGRFGASRASVTVSARNLWTVQDDFAFQVPDPEVFSPINYGGAIHNQGVLPLPFTLTTTLNLTF